MIEVSQLFKEAAKENLKPMVRARAIFELPNGEAVVVSEGDNLVEYSIESTGRYFEAAASIATVKLLGTDWELSEATAILELDLLLSDETYETVSYGEFKVSSDPASLDTDTTTIKMYSEMAVLQTINYEEGQLTFPCTIAEMAAQIAEHFKLTLEGMSELPNVDYEIQEDLYAKISNLNYRDILAEIAGATATMATISHNVLSFRTLQTEVQETLTYDNMMTAEKGASWGPVNSVVLARTPQEDNIVVTDDEDIELHGLTEVKLANNEIMDDEREFFAEALLEAVEGFDYTGFEVETTGHGYYEPGDRILVEKDDGTTFEGIITDIPTFAVAGNIKEVIRGVIPDATTTDYSLAGGITKTVYNTGLKVDRQAQEIVGVVERQETFEGQTIDDFTRIAQNLTEVVTSVQNSGGNNLLLNSAMYEMDNNGLPLNWELDGEGTIAVESSAEAATRGSLSKRVIWLADEAISQTVSVKMDQDDIPEETKTYYSFSCRIKKLASGTATVTITDGVESSQIVLNNGVDADYDEYSLEAILPNSTSLTVTVEADEDAGFGISDMMLAVGGYRSRWTQANGEFANSQFAITVDGTKASSNANSGTYSTQDYQGFSTFENNILSSALTKDELIAPSGRFSDGISMPPIKIVPRSDGWAFVKTEN